MWTVTVHRWGRERIILFPGASIIKRIVRKATRVGEAQILEGREECRMDVVMKNELFKAEVRQAGTSIWVVFKRWERCTSLNIGANDWHNENGLRLVITLKAVQPRKNNRLVTIVFYPVRLHMALLTCLYADGLYTMDLRKNWWNMGISSEISRKYYVKALHLVDQLNELIRC